MKPFVAVIGGNKSGKSTIIRSLTGCPFNRFEGVIEERVNHTKIYVVAHSPQEDGLREPRESRGQQEKLETILQRVAEDPTILGIVIAIQPTIPTRRLSMEGIIQRAQQMGVFAIHTFIINPPYNGEGGINVDNVRTRLQAIPGISINEINGRNFSYLNARVIQQIAGLP